MKQAIGLRKQFFLRCQEFVSWTLISKMGVKMNLRIIMKNLPADLEIWFLTKAISKPNGHATAVPTALELKTYLFVNLGHI